MSFSKKEDEETQSILNQSTDYWDTSTPKFIYVQKRSVWVWIVIALLLVVAITAITLSAVTLCAYNKNQMQRRVTFVWYGGEFDSHMSVDKEQQIEKMEIPMSLTRKDGVVTGKAQLLHDFKAGYTVYKPTIGDVSVCYINKLNNSIVMYDPDKLFDFLKEYKDQIVQRAPRVKVGYSSDSVQEITDLSILDSPHISELCINAKKSYLLGPGKEMEGRSRRMNSACLFNFSLWGADIKVGCVDFEFYLLGDK